MFGFSQYTVTKEESSILLEVVLSAIMRNKLHTNMCLFPNGYHDTAVWIYTFKQILNGNKEKETTYH